MGIRYIDQEPTKAPSIRYLDEEPPRDYSPVRQEYTGITAPLGRLSEDVRNRAAAVAEIQAMRDRGEITKPEEVLYMAGTGGAGLVGDIGANIIETGVSSADYLTGGALSKTGDLLGAGARNVGSFVGRLPSMGGGTIGERLPGELGGLLESSGDFAEKNRRAAIAAKSVGNLALLAPAVKYGEDIISAGGKLKRTVDASKVSKMSANELREKSSDLYKLAESKGGKLKPEFTEKLFQQYAKVKSKTAAGDIIEGQSDAARIIRELGDEYSGKSLNFETLMEMDEKLGQKAFSQVDNFGKVNDEGRKLLQMQSELRSALNSADDSLFVGGRGGFEVAKEAKKYWSAQAQMRDVERIIENAQYMQQPSTALKTGFRTLLRDKKRMKGYSPEARFAIEKAAKTGGIEGFYRLLGSDLVPIIAASAGGGATLSAGGVGALAAIPARIGQKLSQGQAIRMAQRKARQVEDAIRAGVLTPEAGKTEILKAYRDLGVPTVMTAAPISGATYLEEQVAPIQETMSERARRIYQQKGQNQ